MIREVEVSVLCAPEAQLPEYGTLLAAGADVQACLSEPVTLAPGASALIPTGLRIAIPEGYEMQVRPRSGLALKHGVTVLNTPGTIDADYRGEVGIVLINHGRNPFVIEPGMRIAQWVLAPVVRAKYVAAESLVATARGEGGFGHTGTDSFNLGGLTRLLRKKGELMPIADYLDERLILFLHAQNREECLSQLVDALDEAGKLPDKKVFHEAILRREKIVSTGVGMGIAIPHAKLSGYSDFFIAVGIQQKQGIEWEALDNAPVRLIFMIGGPDNRQTEYLTILSRLTVAIKEEERRKKMLKATNCEQVLQLFAGY